MIPVSIPPAVVLDTTSMDEASRTQSQQFHRHQQEYVLGTRLEVVVNTRSAVVAEAAVRAVRTEIARLDRVFNFRRADSELAALNRARSAVVSPEFFTLVQVAETWRRLTGGAFDGRLGELLSLWGSVTTPSATEIARALHLLHESSVLLDHVVRRVELSPSTTLSLDAVAKGYIVDEALTAARRAAPGLDGLAVEIGGDLRCWGEAPDEHGWRVGIVDPTSAAMNAPLVETIRLRNGAIATSGHGPRDYRTGSRRSTTISPVTGQPVRAVLAASVIASHAADADAIATACMVLSPMESLALVNRLEGVAARITDAQGQVHTSRDWPAFRLAAATADTSSMNVPKSSVPVELKWPRDWVLSINYTAPPRQEVRSADFRSPYMALWITDEQNRPVRTVYMVGREYKWQRDNFVWWGSNRERATQLVDFRSAATALSGVYPMYWGGVDDDWKPVPIGKYTLHLETSQEHGKHSYRSIALEIGRERFKTELPRDPDSGGIEITYGHPDDDR